MKASDGRDQAESQAVSRCVATLFQSIEALENLLTLIRWNSGSVVGDRNDRATVHGFARNDDLSSVAAVLDCIVHEIGDGIKNQIAIADRQHFAVAGHGEEVRLLGRSIVQLDDLMGDFDEVHGSKRASFRTWVSICAIRVIDVKILKTASRSAMVSPINV